MIAPGQLDPFGRRVEERGDEIDETALIERLEPERPSRAAASRHWPLLLVCRLRGIGRGIIGSHPARNIDRRARERVTVDRRGLLWTSDALPRARTMQSKKIVKIMLPLIRSRVTVAFVPSMGSYST
jgi:hypothetical protein